MLLFRQPERLRTPLIRSAKGGAFEIATWEEALDFTAERIRKIQACHGPDSIGVCGGGLTNETAYLLRKFARQFGYDRPFGASPAATASIKAFGMDRGLPFPLEDIQHAQCILLIGGSVTEAIPPHIQAQAKNGGSLIVVDPRATPTARAATLHLQITPGTDAALANGLLYIAIKEGYIDEAFIHERTSGFGKVRVTVASYWPERVVRITGIPERQLALAARILGEASRAMVLTTHAPEYALAFINLALALGKSGRPYCGYGCLAEPANTLPKPECSAQEMHGLFVFGSNLARPAQKRLEALDFLAVSDSFLSETAALGDVVLPTALYTEEDGTATSIEGRVLLRRKQAEPPTGVRTNLQTISEIAKHLGCSEKFCCDPSEVFDEMKAAAACGMADYTGMNYERLEKENGVFWPCPNQDHPGTPRVFLDQFATSDGRARFHPVEFLGAVEQLDPEYPLYLTAPSGGRKFQMGEPPLVQIHPSMAQTYGIADGDPVDLTTRRGRTRMSAQLTSTVRIDTLFAPAHFAGDEFKVCAVRIEKANGSLLRSTLPRLHR